MLQRLFDIANSSWITGFLLNYAGHSHLGPELVLRLKDLLPSPSQPETNLARRYTFIGRVALHDSWNSIRRSHMENREWFLSLLYVLKSESVVRLLPFLFEIAGYNRLFVGALFDCISRLQAYRRKELIWPHGTTLLVSAAENHLYCKIYLEFFQFTQETALYWLHCFAKNPRLIIRKRVPEMMECAFSDGVRWIISNKVDFDMIRTLFSNSRRKEIPFSKSAYKKITRLIRMSWIHPIGIE